MWDNNKLKRNPNDNDKCGANLLFMFFRFQRSQIWRVFWQFLHQ